MLKKMINNADAHEKTFYVTLQDTEILYITKEEYMRNDINE